MDPAQEIRCEASVCKNDEYFIFIEGLERKRIKTEEKFVMPPRSSSPIDDDEPIILDTFSDSLDEFFYQIWKRKLETSSEDKRRPQCPCPTSISEFQSQLYGWINENIQEAQQRNRRNFGRRRNMNAQRRRNSGAVSRDTRQTQRARNAPRQPYRGGPSSHRFNFDPYSMPAMCQPIEHDQEETNNG